MRPRTVPVAESSGRVLSATIFRSCGKKLLSKGHVLSTEDISLLRTEGLDQVWVTELEEGEIAEDEAVLAVAQAMGCGCLEIRPAAGGRANLFATEDCALLIDDDLLRQINCTSSIAIATLPNFGFAVAGQRIATVKSAPFAVAGDQLEAVLSMIQERGPLMQARPVRNPLVGVLYSDPLQGDRARQLFEGIMRQRLERYGTVPMVAMSAIEDVNSVTRCLNHLLRAKPALILMASTTAPQGPDDVVGQAMAAAGCHLERFLAPVEPGNLFLLGYHEDTPIVSAPGCFRSAKPNVLDLVLPPLLARYRMSGWEIASLGHGGLLG